jgi:hypothetical protein
MKSVQRPLYVNTIIYRCFTMYYKAQLAATQFTFMTTGMLKREEYDKNILINTQYDDPNTTYRHTTHSLTYHGLTQSHLVYKHEPGPHRTTWRILGTGTERWEMNEKWMRNEWEMNEKWMRNEWGMNEEW